MTAVARVTAAARTINVMVVDDSAVVRGLISRRIEEEPDLHVVASAANGEMALVELRRRQVDVVVLDIEMPVMDGLTALPLILAERPGIKVVIASTLTRRNAEISLRALQLGASDYVGKPEGAGSLVTAEDFKRDLIDKVRALGEAAVKARSAAAPSATPFAAPRTAPAPSVAAAPPQIIAIGGSTGAPPVLVRIFESLGVQIHQPILLTQHMPATFTALLAEQLQRAGGRPSAEGRDGEPILPGRTYVAPGNWHMTAAVEGGRRVIRLDQTAQVNFCRPAVDPMFRSLAEIYGAGVLAVILTGMGADGAVGCEAIAKAGGRFAVQDEATSAVWGMPGAAAKTGHATRILPADEIASFLIGQSGAHP